MTDVRLIAQLDQHLAAQERRLVAEEQLAAALYARDTRVRGGDWETADHTDREAYLQDAHELIVSCPALIRAWSTR
jgi:hypothetical protein